MISISPIHGGPTRIGIPNSKPLAQAEFVIKKGEDNVATFTTDEQGRFRVTLPPGHYTVEKKDGGKRRIGSSGPFEVDIAEGQMKQVQWTCDSGMR